jgi:signal transduction histidine kinase
VNKPIISLFEETNQKVLQKYIELVYSSKLYKELRIHEKNNIILNTKISPVQNITGEVISLAFYIQDITQIESDKLEKKQMEEQLIQTQKMETIGTLAGGIAHDFNNYLATIKGYVSMSLEDSQEGSSIYNYLSKTMKAVNLSQGTVQKLLTFSRSKEMELNKFKIKDLITDSIDIVKGSKPKNIQFNYEIPDMELELLGEKNQLTQVLLNICTNAFHAIEAENGGLVNVYIEPPHIIPDLGNKQCICIKIEDNGIGMQKETLERIFEPFYTTKDVGKGTGLGLSVVTGIIKQHGGKIEVHSEFGKGSLFSLYLPIIS